MERIYNYELFLLGLTPKHGLLVEPGATNLILYSQELNDGQWSKVQLNTTGTPAWVNVAVAPDGTTTAEKLIEDTTSNAHLIATSLATTVIASTYTASVFLKADERSNVRLSRNGGAVGSAFNLSTQAITDASGSVGKIEDYGNGWYRCSITFSAASVSTSLYVELQTSASASQETYLGDGTSGLFAWQAQLETGSVATSPIVTTASTASRVADVVSLTGASSLIGQQEGTLYAEVNLTNIAGSRILVIKPSGIDTANFIEISKGASANQIQARILVSPSTIFNQTVSAVAGINKVAFAYKSGQIALYVNGVSASTSTSSFTVGVTLSEINIGHTTSFGASVAFLNDHVRSVALFPTRLENATLASITS
jgi:hypothetical protein